MNRSLKAARLGPLVAVVLVAGCGTSTPASVTTVSQTPTSAGTPTASASPSEESRTHVLSDDSDGAIGVTVTVPAAGWSGEPGGWSMESGPEGFDPPAGAGIIAFVVDEEFYVYGDPCDWKRTRARDPRHHRGRDLWAPWPTRRLGDPSEPEAIAVGGYRGKKITLHVPDDARFSDCDESTFAAFGVAGEEMALQAQGPGEIQEISIVDVNGRIVVLAAGYYPGTPPSLVDELHAIVTSATFD